MLPPKRWSGSKLPEASRILSKGPLPFGFTISTTRVGGMFTNAVNWTQQHLENNDLTKIRRMATNGYRPEADKLQETLNRTNLSQEAKREVLVTLKIDPSKLQKQLFSKGEQAVDTITSKQVIIEETKEKGVVKVIGEDGKKYTISSENLKKRSSLDKVMTQQKGMKIPRKTN